MRYPRTFFLPLVAIVAIVLVACSPQKTPAPEQDASTAPAARAQSAAPAGPRTFNVGELLKLKRVSDPQVSPDGTRVAFVVTEANEQANSRTNHIWTVGLDQGAPAPLLQLPKSEDTPRWSPDGKRLAFMSAREAGSQVWIVDVDAKGVAGTPRRLTDIATEASGPKWSPDGKSIVFASDVYPECTTLDCNKQALAGHEKSTVKARVLDGLLFRHWTAWKDGRFSHLYLVPVDGSQPPRDLTPGKADVPPFSLGGPDDYAFSPDSRELAFVRKTDAVEAVSTNSDLFLLDLADPQAQPRKITTNPAADGGPSYSPDGRYIAYRAQSKPGFESDRWQLMLLDRKSGESRPAAPMFDTWVDSYAWTPDSKGLVLTAELEGRSAMFLLDLAGGAPRLLPVTGSSGDVQFTRDGSTMVFTRSTAAEPVD
ncbi:MAG: TolB family protein, partial [Bacteroidales bacterium]